MSESALTTKILKAIRAKGAWAVKLHGGPTQRAGLPDILVIVQGRAIWLEVKLPGEVATRLQEHTLEQLRQAGCVAMVVRSVEEALAFV